MTDTYSEIRPEPQRDRYGRYLITPPDGGKPRAYTRATTIAETLDDRYNLEAWKVRMTALGIVQRPDLYASIASTPADDKSALNRLCDQAREAAAGSAGANLGTALHRFTERINRGEDVTVPAPWDADVAAYQAAMQFGYRYQINPHWLERIVVLHELQVAGTFDLLLDDMNYRYIADLKTGQELSYSWPAIAVQLALYSRADALYNPTDGTYEDMPAVDQERAVVIHLPAGKATCTIHEVDLVAGWEAAQHAMWVRGWRKRKDLATPCPARNVTPSDSAPSPTKSTTSEDSSPAVPPVNEPTQSPNPSDGQLKKSSSQVETDSPADPARRAAIVDRIKALQPKHLEEMATRWPAGVPTLKQSDAHTDDELDRIEKVLTSIHWHPDRPAPERPEPAPAPDPLPPAAVWDPDEGEMLDDETYEAAKTLYETTEPVLRAQVDAWAREAFEAGRNFSLRHKATERRLEIMRAAIELSPYDEDVARAALLIIYGSSANVGLVGYALGSLTLDEARRLAAIAAAIGTTVAVVYTPAGVTFDGLTAVA